MLLSGVFLYLGRNPTILVITKECITPTGWQDPTPVKNAVMIDLLAYGLLTLIVQYGDNVMFFWRFLAIEPQMSTTRKVLIYLYIFFILTIPWDFTFTIVPFFYNTNSSLYLYAYFWALQVEIYGNILYNLYFSFEFSRILYKIYFDPNFKYSPQAFNISVKSLIHFVLR